MQWWEAVILGIIEGLTEYLPVSSTGHLILTQRLLGIASSDAANAYVICIQLGAIAAVLGIYARRVLQMSRGLLYPLRLVKTDDAPGRALAINILIAFLPAAVAGLLFDDWIDSYLFGLWPIVVAWFLGGLVILLVAWRQGWSDDQRGGLERLTPLMALLIGAIQCAALWPGTSRSLVTILGGLAVGLSLSAAVEFSFLLGVLTLSAATAYKLADAGPIMYETYGLVTPLLGALAAAVSAAAAVAWMVTYLRRHGMALFGYYRVALASLVAALLLAGGIAIEPAVDSDSQAGRPVAAEAEAWIPEDDTRNARPRS